jgi:ABC-type transport system substrate-binding protein
MARNRAHPGLSGKSAGAGPYRIAALEQGQRVVLRRNPNYWDPVAQHFDEIIFHILDGPDQSDILRRLASGALDAAMVTGDAAIQAALKSRRFSVYRRTLDQFGAALGFNRTMAPLGDPVVRLALAQAIDRRAIARALGGGDGDVAEQLFQGKRWRCSDAGYPAFDADGARNILAALDVDFTGITLWTEDTPPLRRAAQLIQAMWAKAGISIGVHVVSANDRSLTYQIDAAIARLGRARSDKDIRAAHCAFEAVKTEVLPYLPVKRGVIGLITRNDIGGVALTGDPVIGYHRMFRK